MTTERTKFMARLENERDAGLMDLKLFFRSSKAMKPAEIFGALNEIEDAIKAGKSTRHEKWSGDDPR